MALRAGEDYFDRAYNLDKKYNLDAQPADVAWIHSEAQLWWANALATIDCAAAQKHFNNAVNILAVAPASIDFDQARSSAKQQWKTGIGGISGCPPDPRTSPLP